MFWGATGGVARSEYFTWQDPQSGVTLSYPDTWIIANNQKPDDRLTIQAPGVHDYASCRLRMREERRAEIYPYQFDSNVQHLYVGFPFWQSYVDEYAGASLDQVLYDRSMLNTIASSADFTFISSAGPKALMRGFAFAGLEDNQLYIFECSAEMDAYDRWYPIFRTVLKSLHKSLWDSLTVNGGYRDFQNDSPVIVRGKNILESYE